MTNIEATVLVVMMVVSLMAALTGCAKVATELSGPITITDGDTVRSGNERIRLLGIDAPELPGHCRKGRHCAPGDPYASKRELQRLVNTGGRVTIERHGKDRYGRTLAWVFVGGENMSCHQLRTGNAIYKPEWDRDGVAGRCAGR